MYDKPPNLAAGGICAWRLPPDETGPAVARSLPRQVMAGLHLDQDIIDNGRLAVSEAATNALRHARPQPLNPYTAPELWVWARTVPAPQLVVSVFDCARNVPPRVCESGSLEECGRGLDILGAVTAKWGDAPSRSRMAERLTRGKTVWFALPLLSDWPGRALRVHPGTAAQCLLLNLGERGFTGRRRSDAHGVSVVELPGLNVWVLPHHFCWQAEHGRHVRRPLIDLQEAAERIIRQVDGSPAHSPTR